MPETTSFNLDTSGARREVEALRAEVQRLNQELLRAGQALASNPSPANGASFFQTAQRLSVAQGNLDNISGSAQPNYGAQSNAGAFARAAAPATVQQQLGNAVAAAQFIQNSALPANVQYAALNMMSGGSIPVWRNQPQATMMLPTLNMPQATMMMPTLNMPQATMMMPSSPAMAFGGYGMMGALPAYGGIGMPSYNWNSQQRGMAYGALAIAGVSALAGGMSQWASNTVSGQLDPMAMAGIYGQSGGAIIGELAGMLATPTAPGAGAMTGALAGGMLGNAAGQMAMAPYMMRRSMMSSVEPIVGLLSNIPHSNLSSALLGTATSYPRGTNPLMGWNIPYRDATPDGLSGIARQISMEGKSDSQRALISAGLYTGTDIISGVQMSAAFGSIAGGMYESGSHPILADVWAKERTANLARRYGINTPQIAQSAARVFAASSRFDGNKTDLLMEFGAAAVGYASQAVGGRALDERQLQAYGDVQSSLYRANVAGMQARGSGFGAAAQFQQAMNALSALPGGANSQAYAEASQRMRNARFEGFRQQDIMSFGIPMIHAQGELERTMMLPFAPGNVMGRQLDISRMANRQAGILERRLNTERGNLSEEQEAQMTQQIEMLKTTAVRGIAMLSEGFENRLPALSAGRTAMFGRLNSFQMAAMAVRGTPMRGFGAADGGQLKEQDAFFSDVGRSFSSTSAVNAGGSVTSLLSRIATSLERMESKGGSGSTRPSEMNGQAAGALYGKRLGQETGGVN